MKSDKKRAGYSLISNDDLAQIFNHGPLIETMKANIPIATRERIARIHGAATGVASIALGLDSAKGASISPKQREALRTLKDAVDLFCIEWDPGR